jgi:thiamine pyrophosphokinase
MTVAVLSSGELVLGEPLARILNSCSVVVAADGGLAALQGQQRVADVVVGDFDSLTMESKDLQTLAKKVERLDHHKDESDTDAAVRRAKEFLPDEIWLVAGSGGRMDHWLSNLRLVEHLSLITRWYTPVQTILRLSPGQVLSITPGLVSVFPLGSGPWNLRSHGLRWPLEPVNFDRWHSLSNQADDGASVESLAGEFLVFQDSGTTRDLAP